MPNKLKYAIALIFACILAVTLYQFIAVKNPSVFVVTENTPQIHRLGLRPATPKQHFYDTATDDSVLLRGNNYLRMTPGGMPNGFEVGTYDKTRNESALEAMKASGYNSVRVTFIYAQMTNKNGTGINPQYIANVTDYLNMAKDNGIYVFGLIAYLPKDGGYWPTSQDPNFEGDYSNKLLLDPSFLQAKKRYVKDILTALKSQNAPLDIVLWGIENEVYFERDKKPFNLSSGTITTANGKSYNMALAEDKLRMADENLANYSSEIRASVKEVDSEALVGISLFSPAGAATTPTWILKTDSLFNNSSIDFITINHYPSTLDFPTVMSSFGIGSSTKPIILSEFGAYPQYYPTIEQGAQALRDFQVLTCRDYGFTGWFAYDWDTTEIASWFRIYQVTESGGVIDRMLGPKYRANPCSPDPAPILGRVESISPTGLITGYVFDPESPASTTINFYLDNAYPPVGIQTGGTTTSIKRSDIQTQNRWMTQAIGFTYQIPQNILTDGKDHTIYAQAVDRQLDGTITSYLIPGSGITLPKLTPATAKPGDLNTDGKVDILDYNLLVSKFGNPYTIFDYNNLVAGYGK